MAFLPTCLSLILRQIRAIVGVPQTWQQRSQAWKWYCSYFNGITSTDSHTNKPVLFGRKNKTGNCSLQMPNESCSLWEMWTPGCMGCLIISCSLTYHLTQILIFLLRWQGLEYVTRFAWKGVTDYLVVSVICSLLDSFRDYNRRYFIWFAYISSCFVLGLGFFVHWFPNQSWYSWKTPLKNRQKYWSLVLHYRELERLYLLTNLHHRTGWFLASEHFSPCSFWMYQPIS